MTKQKSATSSLQITSIGNNAWSAINNYQNKDKDNDNEAIRSLLLFGIDLLNLLKDKFIKNKKAYSSSAELVANILTMQQSIERLSINIDKYNIYVDKKYKTIYNNNKKISYNNGKIPKQLVHDLIADTTLIVQSSLDLTGKVIELSASLLGKGALVAAQANKIISPWSIAFNFISAFFTQLSNRMSQAQNTLPDYENNTEFDVKDFSLSSYLIETLVDTVTDWRFFSEYVNGCG